MWGQEVDRFGDYHTGSVPVRAKGRPYIVANLAREGEARVISLDSPGRHYLSLQGEQTTGARHDFWKALACDLDGDGDHELVSFDKDVVYLRGLRAARRAAAPSAAAAPERPASDRALSYQDAMFALSTYQNARQFDSAVLYLRDLLQVFPEFEKDILVAVARTHQSAHDWESVARTLQELKSKFYLGTSDAAEIDAWLARAREVLAFRTQASVEFREPLPLLVSAPLRFRLDRTRGILTAHGNSQAPGFLAVPCVSDERSHAIEARLRVNRLDYVTGFSIGMSDGVSRLHSYEGGCHVAHGWHRAIAASAAGAGDVPTASGWLAGDAGARVTNIDVGPSDEWMRLRLDTVRGADVVRARFRRDGPDGAPLGECESPVSARHPGGPAFLVVTAGSQAFVSDDYAVEVDIDAVSVLSAGEQKLREFKPQTPHELFLAAGGRFVNGDFEGALADYAKVLQAMDAGLYTGREHYNHEWRDDPRDEIALVRAVAPAARAPGAGGRRDDEALREGARARRAHLQAQRHRDARGRAGALPPLLAAGGARSAAAGSDRGPAHAAQRGRGVVDPHRHRAPDGAREPAAGVADRHRHGAPVRAVHRPHPLHPAPREGAAALRGRADQRRARGAPEGDRGDRCAGQRRLQRVPGQARAGAAHEGLAEAVTRRQT